VWKHADEDDAIHLMLVANADQRHIKLKRSANAAMYDFIVDHAPIPIDAHADNDPETVDSGADAP
jgi:hypothetical protein